MRFIPTHVGLIGVDYERVSDSTVHPHTCGVNADSSLSQASEAGSSPHMWG